MTTETKKAIAIGFDEIQRKAASEANAVQDGVNIVAIVGSFHRHLLALHGSGVRGDDLINLIGLAVFYWIHLLDPGDNTVPGMLAGCIAICPGAILIGRAIWPPARDL